MSEQPPARHQTSWLVVLAVGILALFTICGAGWLWWNSQEQARVRTEAHRGLDGVWIDDSGQDVSYQFREDGEFLIRRKIPSNLAPFSGDPGVEHRPSGKWSRKGQSVTVQFAPNQGFALNLDEDVELRGEHFLDQWSGQWEHSRTKTPVVLKRKASRK